MRFTALSRTLTRPLHTRAATTTQLRPASTIGPTVVDQTKKGNDPGANKKEDHKQSAAWTNSNQSRDDPQQQPDPQATPSRSTGFQTEGTSGKAGTGGEKEMGGQPHKEGGGEGIENYTNVHKK